ncbi:MAG: MFS transporter [Bacillota bacterium]|nr:MFS transporter [Bacillota bacterium]
MEAPARRPLHANVWVTGMISLFTDISSEMIVPVLPLFMTNVLGVAATSIGIIEGIAESTASILKVFSGWISDRAGKRKPMMVLGYGVANLVKPFFAWLAVFRL